MENRVPLGELSSASAKRDCAHVAFIPMLALRVMQPGERLATGIVDPFLKSPVRPGEWYLLCLYPNTVTGMRHSWSHPAYPNEPEARPPKHRSEADVWAEQAGPPAGSSAAKFPLPGAATAYTQTPTDTEIAWLDSFAAKIGLTVAALIASVDRYTNSGLVCCVAGARPSDASHDEWQEFWRRYGDAFRVDTSVLYAGDYPITHPREEVARAD